jgi:hypothetical protein
MGPCEHGGKVEIKAGKSIGQFGVGREKYSRWLSNCSGPLTWTFVCSMTNQKSATASTLHTFLQLNY